MSQVIKTRKIKLIPVAESTQDKKEIYKYIKKVASDLSQAGNKVVRVHIINQFEIENNITEKGLTPQEANKLLIKKLGGSIENSGYQTLSEFSHISSNIRNCFNQTIFKTIKKNFYDILNDKISMPSFRKTNIAIPFQCQNNSVYKNNKECYIKFPLSMDAKKKYGVIEFSLLFGKDPSNNRGIIDKILNGEYTMCDSSFKIEDNDIHLLLTYKFTPKEVLLDKDKIMGLDLGINRTVAHFITKQKHQPRQIQTDVHIQHEIVKREKHRRSIQQSLKHSKGGHGRKRKTEALSNYRHNSADWTQNQNHKISKDIINLAVSCGVGTIKMEDLTGITKKAKNFFMKSWSYDQLQTFIDYKAKENGIQVLWVDPKNTSNTCPTCANSNTENRDDVDRTKFKCINPECEDWDKEQDADLVAAQNIANTFGELVKGKSKEGRIANAKNKKKADISI
jgi:putative transposase